MSTNPFEQPGSTSGIEWKELHGALLLIEPLGIETGIVTTLGTKDATRANVYVVDGPQAGTEYGDTLIFPKLLQGQVRSKIGKRVLGRLTQGVAKPSQDPPWMLAEATPADTQVGIQFLNYLQSKTIAQPAPASPPAQQPPAAAPAWQTAPAQQPPAAAQPPVQQAPAPPAAPPADDVPPWMR